jgi:carbamoyltransferase
MMEKRALMITLGHNSSAVFYDGDSVIGYEQERLDGVKSSSCFPKDAIEKIMSYRDLRGSYLLLSHWYDCFDLDKIEDTKHLDMPYLNDLIEDYGLKLITLSKDFTHHDAHAYSSLAFMLDNIDGKKDKIVGDDIHFLVVDGFGNRQEVVSLYKAGCDSLLNDHSNSIDLVKRVYGCNNSLGMMYQYATAFCGMKENQDEYKFLGYESHIDEILSEEDIISLDSFSDDFIQCLTDSMSVSDSATNENSYIDIDSLSKVRADWNEIFYSAVKTVNMTNSKDFKTRVVIGYFIQKVLEDVLVDLIKTYNIKNLCISGGVFYNVKLNNRLLKELEGTLSVIPLAGDQGAAVGIYLKFVSDFKFGDLCYGVRDEFDYSVLDSFKDLTDRIFVIKNRSGVCRTVVNLLKNDEIVNFVEGGMEFGPRALCHTSTLAIPSSENVEIINTLNKRNTVMPMAPVMLEKSLEYFFEDDLYSRVVGSDRFMIVTYDYRDDVDIAKYRGVMHKYPRSSVYSGRPQVVKEDDDKLVKDILEGVYEDYKCLVNTSYNVHGNPILFSYRSVLEDFIFQCDIAAESGVKMPYLVMYV